MTELWLECHASLRQEQETKPMYLAHIVAYHFAAAKLLAATNCPILANRRRKQGNLLIQFASNSETR